MRTDVIHGIKWFDVKGGGTEDEAFSKVALFNDDIYFAIECFGLDKSDGLEIIQEVNGLGFFVPPIGQLSGLYMASQTMIKALQLKQATSDELKEFKQIVQNTKEQCVMSKVLRNFKSDVIN